MQDKIKPDFLSVKYTSEGILSNLKNQIKLAETLKPVYDNRPEPKEFEGILADDPKFAKEYSKEEIQKDIDYVKDTKSKIEQSYLESGKLDLLEQGFSLSEMMQAMIVDMINRGMFPNFKAVMTSERDDLRIGIDAVLKRDEGKYLGAAFDFSLSGKESDIENKLEKIWNFGIEKHAIPVVKYFKDPDSGRKGSLMVPKFVIGASKKEIEDFAQKYLDGKQDELKNHPFKYLMVKQIDEQLKAALSFFEKNSKNPEYDFIHNQYKKIELFIEELKKDINYADFTKGKDFFDYKKQNVAYNTMRKFFADKI
jgi:hypothetical protein